VLRFNHVIDFKINWILVLSIVYRASVANEFVWVTTSGFLWPTTRLWVPDNSCIIAFHLYSFPQHSLLPPHVPSILPGVRCYLGYASPFDYNGKPLVKSFKRWFEKLVSMIPSSDLTLKA
jgi:hypothetical protein